MQNVKNALTSKRVWVIIIMFLVNGVAAVSDQLPAEAMNWINPILLVLGVLSGVKPK